MDGPTYKELGDTVLSQHQKIARLTAALAQAKTENERLRVALEPFWNRWKGDGRDLRDEDWDRVAAAYEQKADSR